MSNVTPSPVTPSPSGVPAPVASRLQQLRRRVSTWLLMDGMRRFLLWLVGLVVLDLLVDWYFHMDRPQRFLSLALILGILAIVAWRHIIRPLRNRLSDDALCMEVERRHGELGESLISALQFSRNYDAEALGVSRTMVRATIDRGTQASQRVEFTSVLDLLKFRRNLALVLVAGLILLGMGGAAAGTPLGRTMLDRIFGGRAELPQNTNLILKGVVNDELHIPRGDDWEQVVEVSGIVPELVELDYQPGGWSSRTTEQMNKQGDREFHSTFKNVLDEVKFRVRGGDAQTNWIQVVLIERPAVATLELRLTPPNYITTGVETLPPGQGPYYAYKGSSLEIRGTSNKDLAEARVAIGDRDHLVATLDDPRTFHVVVPPDKLGSQVYGVELTDSDHWSSKHPARFSVKMKLDTPPVIKSKLVGISSMIVPKAKVPAEWRMSDDFLVTGATLVWQWHSDGSDQTSKNGRIVLDDPKIGFAAKSIDYTYPLEVEPLGPPAGSTLSFHLEARDNDTVSGPKTGKSDDFVLKVVTEDELRADLLRREREQRVEVERLLKEVDELATDTKAVLAAVRGVADMPVDQRQLLDKDRKRQTPCSQRLKTVATHLSQILSEVENNRLEDEKGPFQQRLKKSIIDPLQSLAEEGPDGVPEAVRLLDLARQAKGAAATRDEALGAAAAQQDKIVKTLRDVLKNMAKTEGYQEAVNLLSAVLQTQEAVSKETIEEARRRINNELSGPEGDKKTPEPPAPKQ